MVRLFGPRFGLALLSSLLALSLLSTIPLAPPASAILVLSPSGQPFDFSNQVRNRWTGECNSYTLWGSPWFVQGPECDRYLMVNATTLRQAGFDISAADGSQVDGNTLFRDGLTITPPGGAPVDITNGWQMLALFDTNGDRQVNANDTTWSHLGLFADANGNSEIEVGEEEDINIVSSLGTVGGPATPDPLGNVRSDGTWEDVAGISLPATDVVFAQVPPFLYGGLPHHPLGTASLSTVGGRLKISNLGSSGCDGFSIDLGSGGAAGGVTEFAQGVEVRAEHKDWIQILAWSWGPSQQPQKRPTAVEYAIIVSLIAASPGGGDHETLITPPVGVSTATVVVTLDGEVVATQKGYDYAPILSTDDVAAVSAGSECSPSSAGGPPYPCVETGAITLQFDSPTTLTIPGLPPVTGDRVSVVGENATEDVSRGLCHVDVIYENTPAGTEADADPPAMSLWGLDLLSSGQAEMARCSDCLVISNIGSSGDDGVSLDLDDNLAGVFNLRHPPGVDPAGYLELQSRGTLSGNPDTFLGSLRLRPDGPDRLELVPDYSPLGAQTMTVEFYASGEPVPNGTYTVQMGPIFVLQPPTPAADPGHPSRRISPGWPSSCGKTFFPSPFILCYVAEWPDLRTMEIPGLPQVTADEVRVLANAQITVDSLDRISLVGAGIPGGQFKVTSVRNSIFGDPDFDVLQVRATGGAAVRRTGRNPQTGKEIRISNLGSSGCDGVSVDMDPNATVLAVDIVLPLGLAEPAPTGTVSHGTEDINIGIGELQECTISKSIDTANVAFTPDFSGIGGTNLRLRLWRDNVLRAEVPIVNGQEACSVPVWPTNLSTFYQTDDGGQRVTYYAYELKNVQVVSYNKMKGVSTTETDLIQIVANIPDLPASISTASLRASGLPYLNVTVVPGGGIVTGAPVPTRYADVLHPNAPNPFNPLTNLRFTLSRSGPVELAIYGLDGRRVDTLVRGEMDAGDHRWTWNGTDAQGKLVASGTYFVQLRTDEGTQARKIALVK